MKPLLFFENKREAFEEECASVVRYMTIFRVEHTLAGPADNPDILLSRYTAQNNEKLNNRG